MFTPRFTMIVGLVIGAVWAITDVKGALITAAMGALGLFIGLVVSQGLDLSQLTSRQNRDGDADEDF